MMGKRGGANCMVKKFAWPWYMILEVVANCNGDHIPT